MQKRSEKKLGEATHFARFNAQPLWKLFARELIRLISAWVDKGKFQLAFPHVLV